MDMYWPSSEEEFETYLAQVEGRTDMVTQKTLKEALKQSLVHWHPLRGRMRGKRPKNRASGANQAAYCGVCRFQKALNLDEMCETCPIAYGHLKWYIGALYFDCNTPNHVWRDWSHYRGDRYAEAMYQLILHAYCSEVSKEELR